MVVDKNNQDHLKKLTDKGLSIEERTALLVEFLSGVEPSPGLTHVLQCISEDYNKVKIAYNSLADDISSKMFSLLVEINNKKTEAVKIDLELLDKEKESNRYCSIYAKIPPLSDLKGDQDYGYFLSKYQEGTKLSQEISALNLQVVHLLEVQESLDHAFSASMIEMDYLMRRLNETIKTFRYMKTPDLLENYKNSNCFYRKLQMMIETKNKEFRDVLKKSGHILSDSEAIVSKVG